MRGKRGLSSVVATVLLVLLTITAVGIVAGVVIPLVRNLTEASNECYYARSHVTFAETDFACSVSGTPSRTGFSIQRGDADVVGFAISLYADGTSDPFIIRAGSLVPELRMLEDVSDFGTTGNPLPLKFPKPGGALTYVANKQYTRADVHAIVASDKSCDVSDTVLLMPCTSPGIISKLTNIPLP